MKETSGIPDPAMTLSVPSYVIPGTWLENIRHIDKNMPSVSNTELLFFIYDDETKRLFRPEEKEVFSYQGRLSFTIHLPDPLLPEHEELVGKTAKIAEHWIIHPPEDGREKNFIRMVNRWAGIYGNRFLIENLIYRDSTIFIKDTGWPLCMDTGHMLLGGGSPPEYLETHKERIKEIHLHDVVNGKDHSPLSARSKWLYDFIPMLESFGGIINIELFSESDVNKSLEVLNDIIKK